MTRIRIRAAASPLRGAPDRHRRIGRPSRGGETQPTVISPCSDTGTAIVRPRIVAATKDRLRARRHPAVPTRALRDRALR